MSEQPSEHEIGKGIEAILDTFTNEQVAPLISILHDYGIELSAEQRLRAVESVEFIPDYKPGASPKPSSKTERDQLYQKGISAEKLGLLRTAQTFYNLADAREESNAVYRQRNLPRVPSSEVLALQVDGAYKNKDYVKICQYVSASWEPAIMAAANKIRDAVENHNQVTDRVRQLEDLSVFGDL